MISTASLIPGNLGLLRHGALFSDKRIKQLIVKFIDSFSLYNYLHDTATSYR